MPRSPLPLLVPLCTRSAAPMWALLRLHPLLLSLASLRLLAGCLSPIDVLVVDSGSGAQARDRASWLARGSAPLPNATLLPRCRMLIWRTGDTILVFSTFASLLPASPGAFLLTTNWRTGRCPTRLTTRPRLPRSRRSATRLGRFLCAGCY